MKSFPIMAASLALLFSSSFQASAACLDEIARLSPGTTTGPDPATTASVQQQGRVAKDGTNAPLQPGNDGSSRTTGSSDQASTTGGPGIAKDGSTMPLADKPGEAANNVATSQQDAQAQQRGGQTAAATGQAGMSHSQSSGYHSPQMMAALDKARSLAQRGDEAGCLQALQEARRLKE